MLARKMTWLAVAIFLLAFSSPANSQSAKTKNSPLKLIIPKKEWRIIDGFRSAKFGMDEKQVMRAIAKDFKVFKEKVERLIPPKEKTTVLSIHVPKLMELGGPSNIFYVLGYKSKRLIQVNIDWGKGVTDNFSSKDLFTISNLLRKHFAKRKYKSNGYAVNKKMNDNSVLVFRGQNKKGRGITLILESAKKEEGIEADKSYSLSLSYISDIKNPDIFIGKAD
jgi:hypothetical protein